MAEPNDQLRRARERTESPHASGDCLSRQELAELVNAWMFEHKNSVVELDANYIGKLEQGAIRWPQDPDRREAFRAVLAVSTDAELGFRRPRRSRTTLVGVDRKQFIGAGLGLGAAAAAGPSALITLLASAQPTHVPAVVDLSDVAEVRAVAAAFEGWDHRFGGGVMRPAVAAQLRYCAELLNARCSEPVRAELFSAVGELAQTAGTMAFDTFAHDDARRVFSFALSCAEEVDDWHLRAKVLATMANQEMWCGNPDAGLTVIEQALVRADRLTATRRASLLGFRASALGKLGRVQDMRTAVGLADEEFARRRPADDPPSVIPYDADTHSSHIGFALWDVALHGQFVGEARDRLSTAVAGYGEARARGRARSQIRLASLVMVTGDPAEAAAIGVHALDAAGAIRSGRAAEDLRDLRRLSKPHEGLTEVAELRHRIGAVVARV